MQNSIENLAEQLGQLLLDKSWMVTTAESCTGGGIAAAITSVSGSSQWFGAGFVCYSNYHKAKVLNVNGEILESKGAVSEAVVIEMAEGALQAAEADIAVAVSGIAGPDGGSEDKPVGTVWLAVATKEKSFAVEHLFRGNRSDVRRKTVFSALEALNCEIKTTV